jgi:hypothetical protein
MGIEDVPSGHTERATLPEIVHTRTSGARYRHTVRAGGVRSLRGNTAELRFETSLSPRAERGIHCFLAEDRGSLVASLLGMTTREETYTGRVPVTPSKERHTRAAPCSR